MKESVLIALMIMGFVIGCGRQEGSKGGTGDGSDVSSGRGSSEYHRGPQGAQAGGGSKTIQVNTGTEGLPTEATYKNVVTNDNSPLGGAKGVGTLAPDPTANPGTNAEHRPPQ